MGEILHDGISFRRNSPWRNFPREFFMGELPAVEKIHLKDRISRKIPVEGFLRHDLKKGEDLNEKQVFFSDESRPKRISG